jgi:hypothetical protein
MIIEKLETNCLYVRRVLPKDKFLHELNGLCPHDLQRPTLRWITIHTPFDVLIVL